MSLEHPDDILSGAGDAEKIRELMLQLADLHETVHRLHERATGLERQTVVVFGEKIAPARELRGCNPVQAYANGFEFGFFMGRAFERQE